MIKIILLMGIFSFLNTSSGADAQYQEQIKALVYDTTNTILVDVRTPEEFATEHAQHSINIDSRTLPQQIDFFKKNKGKNFVIYCKSGMRSANAVNLLKKQGIENVYDAHTVKNIMEIQQQKR